MRHMLPNVMAPYLIMLTAFLGQAVLLESSLSFLGLGSRAHSRVGLMLRGAAVEFAERRPGWPSSRAGHQPVGLRLQSLRRLAPGRARSAPADAVTCRDA